MGDIQLYAEDDAKSEVHPVVRISAAALIALLHERVVPEDV